MRAIIVTVGTSLRTNFQKQQQGMEVSEFNLRKFLDESVPGTASAETNNLEHLKIYKSDFLYFICSDNDTGECCGHLLQDYYSSRYRCLAETIRIPGLCKNCNEFQERGLKNFVNYIADIIERHAGNAIIVATGGFKAEIAFATLLGLLYRLEVQYIHEDFSRPIIMPHLPITFDYNHLNNLEPAFTAILNAPTRKEAVGLIKELPPEFQSLFEKNRQQKYDFSPLGLALRRAKENALKNRRRKALILEVEKQHSHLWGDGNIAISDVPDLEFRIIFKRLEYFGGLIQRLYLDFMEKGSSGDRYMELKKKETGVLTYKLYSPQGCEYLKIYTEPGQEAKLLELLGRKVYA